MTSIAELAAMEAGVMPDWLTEAALLGWLEDMGRNEEEEAVAGPPQEPPAPPEPEAGPAAEPDAGPAAEPEAGPPDEPAGPAPTSQLCVHSM